MEYALKNRAIETFVQTLFKEAQMSLNTILLIIGIVLLVLADVAYYGGIMGGAAVPLLIIGVLAVVAGRLIRGS